MSQDLYSELLRIPPGPRPPNHYELLGLPLFEADPRAVKAAVARRTAELERWQFDPNPELGLRVQMMLAHVRRAGLALGDPKAKAEYDERLAEQLGLRPSAAEAPVSVEEVSEGLPRQPGAATGRCPVCSAVMDVGQASCRACGYDAAGARRRRLRRAAIALGAALGIAAVGLNVALMIAGAESRGLTRELGVAWKTWEDTLTADDEDLLAKHEPSALASARKRAAEAASLAAAGATREAVTLATEAAQALRAANGRARAAEAARRAREITQPPMPTPPDLPKPKTALPAPRPVRPPEPAPLLPKPVALPVPEPPKPEPPKPPQPLDLLAALPDGAKLVDVPVPEIAGAQVAFKAGRCEAVLKLPEALEKFLSLEQTKSGLRVNYTTQAGMSESLLECESHPAEKRLVWILGAAATGPYAAWVSHLVLVAVDRSDPEKAVAYRCLRQRKDPAAELLLLRIKDDGSEEPGRWALAYPWPEALSAQHEEHAEGKPVPVPALTKNPVLLRRKLASGQRTEVLCSASERDFRKKFRKLTRPEPERQLGISMAASVEMGTDPKTAAGKVILRLASSDVCEYVKALHQNEERARRVGEALQEDVNRIRSRTRSFDGKSSSSSLHDRPPTAVQALRDDQAYLEDLLKDVQQGQAAARERWKELKAGLVNLGTLTILDAWGVPVARLAPKIELDETVADRKSPLLKEDRKSFPSP